MDYNSREGKKEEMQNSPSRLILALEKAQVLKNKKIEDLGFDGSDDIYDQMNTETLRWK